MSSSDCQRQTSANGRLFEGHSQMPSLDPGRPHKSAFHCYAFLLQLPHHTDCICSASSYDKAGLGASDR